MTDTITIILTLCGLSFGNVAIMVSLFLWLRSEANADRRYLTEVQSQDRKDLLTLLREQRK